MKQVLFILLVFISFRGFSQTQTVKLNRIGLEVMKTDLGTMTWEDAVKACKKLGGDWRLPTKEECKNIHKYKDRIGGFTTESYWVSAEGDSHYFYSSGDYSDGKDGTRHVRAVRDLE
jgi:hypothetical protein